MPVPSRYTWNVYPKDASVVIVVDLYDPREPTMSVTNNVEWIIKEISSTLRKDPTVLHFACQDTERKWDYVIATGIDSQGDPIVKWVYTDVHSLEKLLHLIQIYNQKQEE